jgi:hypothetical protein
MHVDASQNGMLDAAGGLLGWGFPITNRHEDTMIPVLAIYESMSPRIASEWTPNISVSRNASVHAPSQTSALLYSHHLSFSLTSQSSPQAATASYTHLF